MKNTNNAINTYISLNIKHLIEINKLSQKEFGELFGLKQAVISAYIRKVSNPQLDTLIKISDYFNITIDDLLKRDLSQHPASQTKEVVHDDHTIKLYEQLLESKDEVITALRKEVARLSGEDNNQVGQTG